MVADAVVDIPTERLAERLAEWLAALHPTGFPVRRAIDGNASAADAMDMGARVPGLAEQAWHFARRAGAPA